MKLHNVGLLWLTLMSAMSYGVNIVNKSFALSSPAFENNQKIPEQYTCDGKNISPALFWSGAPAGTKSFALIVDDPDAPKAKPWVHWVVFNISASITRLSEHVQQGSFIMGQTDFGHNNYGGPCPPSGKHRYFFTIYALDAMLNLDKNATKEDVIAAMQGHILGQAQLIGTYEKKKQYKLKFNSL